MRFSTPWTLVVLDTAQAPADSQARRSPQRDKPQPLLPQAVRVGSPDAAEPKPSLQESNAHDIGWFLVGLRCFLGDSRGMSETFLNIIQTHIKL